MFLHLFFLFLFSTIQHTQIIYLSSLLPSTAPLISSLSFPRGRKGSFDKSIRPNFFRCFFQKISHILFYICNILYSKLLIGKYFFTPSPCISDVQWWYLSGTRPQGRANSEPRNVATRRVMPKKKLKKGSGIKIFVLIKQLFTDFYHNSCRNL